MTIRRAAMHRTPQHASPARTYSPALRHERYSHVCDGRKRKRKHTEPRLTKRQWSLAQNGGPAVNRAVWRSQKIHGAPGVPERRPDPREYYRTNGHTSPVSEPVVTTAPQAGGANGHSYEARVQAVLTPKRFAQWQRLIALGYGFDWKVPEVEALHGVDSKAVEIFKRFRQVYDEQFRPIPGKYR